MDIGAIVKAPLDDKDWVKKCLLMGLFTILVGIIPIVGAIVAGLNIAGWMKTAYQNRAAGHAELPDAGFGYIGKGVEVLVAFLPLVALAIGFAIVSGILGWAFGLVSETLAGLVVGLLGLAFGVSIAVLAPAMMYRHLAHGAKWAALEVGPALAVAKANTGAYVMLVVTMILASFIGSLGAAACGVGMLLTLPLSYAIQAAAFDAFRRETRA